MSRPYTYFLHWTEYNMSYYGRRTAVDCDPSELWVSYFTSSKYVNEFRNQYGEPDIINVCSVFDDPVKCAQQEMLVLNEFNAAKDPFWLNRSNGDMKFDTSHTSNAIDSKTGDKLGMIHISDPRWKTGEIMHHLKGRTQTAEANKKRSNTQRGIPKPHSAEHGIAISNAKKGCKAPNKGIPHSAETKEKIRLKAIGRKSALKGIPKSEEQKKKQSETMKRKRVKMV